MVWCWVLVQRKYGPSFFSPLHVWAAQFNLGVLCQLTCCNMYGPCVCHCGTHLGPILGITHLKLEATSHLPHECLVASCFPVCLPLILISSCSFIHVKTSYVFRTMRVHRATYKRITWPSPRLQGAYSFPGRIRYIHETVRTVKM